VTSAVERTISPEEQELARYLAVIEDKIRQVAAAQAELESLRDALSRFNAEYHARVEIWLVEAHTLEREADEYRLRLQLAKQRASQSMEEILAQVNRVFKEQRERHEEEEARSKRFRDQSDEFREQPQLDEAQASRFKQLFRELAKRFHPDLAKNETEHQERTRRMQAVTDAFHRRDLDALERLSLSDDVGSGAFDRLSIAEKLVWAIREVARLDLLLRNLEVERHGFTLAPLYRLLEEQQTGLDPLTQLESKAKQQREQAAQDRHDAMTAFLEWERDHGRP
jgi:hypothetical protein